MAVEVDVAVVGGGPAGAATAFYLARAGHSVLVVEQKTFPRHKTCGDGLTPRAISVLEDMGLDDAMHGWQRVAGVQVTGEGVTRAVAVPPTRRWGDHGLVVPRRVLDQVVLDHAEAAGAQVRYATKALRPVLQGDAVRGVVTKSRGREETIRARWLVCAEGAAGTIRRGLGRKHDPRHPVGVAVREYRPAGPAALEWFDVDMDLREDGRGRLPGYGWAFPIADGTVNVGVVLLNTGRGWRRVRLRDHLDRYVATLAGRGIVDAAAPGQQRRGGRLFMGCSVWPPHGDGYVLVGDAGGMINPATGEGIAYAYETGRAAARHLDRALQTGTRDLRGYAREVRRAYGGYYRVGRGLATAIAEPPRMDRLVRHTTAGDRRMRFVATWLFNVTDPAVRNLDQFAIRTLNGVARATRWLPTPAAGGRGGRRS